MTPQLASVARTFVNHEPRVIRVQRALQHNARRVAGHEDVERPGRAPVWCDVAYWDAAVRCEDVTDAAGLLSELAQCTIAKDETAELWRIGVCSPLHVDVGCEV